VDSCPAWSPDGNQIAFASTRANTIKLSLQTTQIFVMDIDGSNIRQLTNTRGQSLCPGWSPDGKKIAFYSDVGEAQIPTHAIYVMSAEGSGLTRITSTQVDAYFPTWRPLKK
jgi:TolB protein